MSGSPERTGHIVRGDQETEDGAPHRTGCNQGRRGIREKLHFSSRHSMVYFLNDSRRVFFQHMIKASQNCWHPRSVTTFATPGPWTPFWQSVACHYHSMGHSPHPHWLSGQLVANDWLVRDARMCSLNPYWWLDVNMNNVTKYLIDKKWI